MYIGKDMTDRSYRGNGMLLFVFGGSGSGKSEYAEQRILEAGEMPRYYVATMEPFGEEGKKRIERHRKLRAGKGFVTVECATHLEQLHLLEKGAVLLEDLSNLLSNEIWSANGRGWSQDLAEEICRTIKALSGEQRLVVVVGNDIHRDGESQTTEMEQYASLLAECQTRLAAMADEVVEVVCGIAVAQGKVFKNEMAVWNAPCWKC